MKNKRQTFFKYCKGEKSCQYEQVNILENDQQTNKYFKLNISLRWLNWKENFLASFYISIWYFVYDLGSKERLHNTSSSCINYTATLDNR